MEAWGGKTCLDSSYTTLYRHVFRSSLQRLSSTMCCILSQGARGRRAFRLQRPAKVSKRLGRRSNCETVVPRGNQEILTGKGKPTFVNNPLKVAKNADLSSVVSHTHEAPNCHAHLQPDICKVSLVVCPASKTEDVEVLKGHAARCEAMPCCRHHSRQSLYPGS